jgi:hypothetical protein
VILDCNIIIELGNKGNRGNKKNWGNRENPYGRPSVVREIGGIPLP